MWSSVSSLLLNLGSNSAVCSNFLTLSMCNSSKALLFVTSTGALVSLKQVDGGM